MNFNELQYIKITMMLNGYPNQMTKKYIYRPLEHLIPSRFTTEFILECAEFILKNNYFKFDGVLISN